MNYFSIGVTNNSGTGAVWGEYGLPFTRSAADPEGSGTLVSNPDPQLDASGRQRFLSSKVYNGSGALLRYSYVGYDGDNATMSTRDHSNRRLRSERTVYVDDANSYTTVDHQDFDGLGHFRKLTLGGSFGATSRQEYTGWNKADSRVALSGIFDSGEYKPYDTNPFSGFNLPSSWLLNTFTSQSVTEGSNSSEVLAYFASNGLLKRSRVLAAGTPQAFDLVTRFSHDTRGFVTTEEYFGGDTQAVDTTEPLATTMIASVPKYRIETTNVPNFTTLRMTTQRKYAGAAYFAMDVESDLATGLPRARRDSAGIATTFGYREMGRLETVSSPGSAPTTFRYFQAIPANETTAAVPARVEAEQSDSSDIMQRVAYFDAFGRVWREKTRMPGDQEGAPQWSIVERLYDHRGQTKSVSEPGGLTFAQDDETPEGDDALIIPLPMKTTLSNYDPFGRVGTVQTPDGKLTSFVYKGVRLVDRFLSIKTTASGETIEKTTETYDHFGRLVGVTDAAATTASYTYDEGGRLSAVSMAGQMRTFDYDRRGFLVSEDHPERDTVSYTDYDARGHAKFTELSGDSAFDLRTTYDSFERVASVESRNPFYNSASSDPDRQQEYRLAREFAYSPTNGRPLSSASYNYAPLEVDATTTYLDQDIFRVTEVYGYNDNDLAGRLTDTTTTISRSPSIANASWTTVRAVDQQVTYDNFSRPLTLTYPWCTGCPEGGLTWLDNTYESGRLVAIPGYINRIQYHVNALPKSIAHTNGVTETHAADTFGMPRPGSVTVESYQQCGAPATTITPNGGTLSGSSPITLSANASGTPPLAYQWYTVSAGLLTPIVGATDSTYDATPSVDTNYAVKVTGPCGVAQSQTVTVVACAAPSISSITPSQSVPKNSSVSFSVTASGAGLSYAWYRRSVPHDELVSSAQSFDLTMTVSGTYYVLISNNCGSTQSANIVIQVPLDVPQGVDARRTGTAQITVDWLAVSGATQYRLERRSGAIWNEVAVLTTTSFVDGNVIAGNAYAYRVRAEEPGTATVSLSSSADAATLIAFSTIAAGGKVMTVHLTELLNATNALLAAGGGTPISFPTPAPAGGAIIKKAHIDALRSGMDTARTALGLTLYGYSNPDLTAQKIKAVHLTELQERAK